jgi:hypothetical protein
MSKYRLPSENSDYYIPKEDYLTAIHYALRYPLWKEEVDCMADTSKAITYDKDRVQTSNSYDATFEAAVRISDSYPMSRIRMIDNIIALVANGQDYYLRLGVCYGLTYNQLRTRKMPMGHRQYYEMRRKFYYELSKRI